MSSIKRNVLYHVVFIVLFHETSRNYISTVQSRLNEQLIIVIAPFLVVHYAMYCNCLCENYSM